MLFDTQNWATTAGIPYLGIFTRISTLAVLDLANAIQTWGGQSFSAHAYFHNFIDFPTFNTGWKIEIEKSSIILGLPELLTFLFGFSSESRPISGTLHVREYTAAERYRVAMA